MDGIPINEYARIAGRSASTQRRYVKPYQEALQLLKQQGYVFNYKVVLFLSYVLSDDVRKFYPNEDEEKLKVEQKKIVDKVNEILHRQY